MSPSLSTLSHLAWLAALLLAGEAGGHALPAGLFGHDLGGTPRSSIAHDDERLQHWAQQAGLDVPEGLKQYIGSMVSGLQADKEALQAMQAQIDELKKDRDTLQIAQNQQPLQPNINKTEASAIARQASFRDVVSTRETARRLQETTTPGGCSGDQLAARGQAAMHACRAAARATRRSARSCRSAVMTGARRSPAMFI